MQGKTDTKGWARGKESPKSEWEFSDQDFQNLFSEKGGVSMDARREYCKE